MSVCTWTFAVGTITFERISGFKKNLVHDPDPDPDLEQDFDFDKNFEERHQIWWVSLVYKE